MFEKIKQWLKSFYDPHIRELPAQSNWKGIPPKDLSWKDAWEVTKHSIVPMTLTKWPSDCPVCGDPLEEHSSDWTAIPEAKGGGQHMVWGLYCKKGHWTHLECA